MKIDLEKESKKDLSRDTYDWSKHEWMISCVVLIILILAVVGILVFIV